MIRMKRSSSSVVGRNYDSIAKLATNRRRDGRQVIETSFGMGRISFYEAQVDRAAGTSDSPKNCRFDTWDDSDAILSTMVTAAILEV